MLIPFSFFYTLQAIFLMGYHLITGLELAILFIEIQFENKVHFNYM